MQRWCKDGCAESSSIFGQYVSTNLVVLLFSTTPNSAAQLSALTLMCHIQPSHHHLHRRVQYDLRRFRVAQDVELGQRPSISGRTCTAAHQNDLLNVLARHQVWMELDEQRDIRTGARDAEVQWSKT